MAFGIEPVFAAEMTARVRTIGEFLRVQAVALGRIAGATRGDMSVEDVKQEAWLVAAEIEQRRGYPVDFGDAADPSLC